MTTGQQVLEQQLFGMQSITRVLGSPLLQHLCIHLSPSDATDSKFC